MFKFRLAPLIPQQIKVPPNYSLHKSLPLDSESEILDKSTIISAGNLQVLGNFRRIWLWIQVLLPSRVHLGRKKLIDLRRSKASPRNHLGLWKMMLFLHLRRGTSLPEYGLWVAGFMIPSMGKLVIRCSDSLHPTPRYAHSVTFNNLRVC